MQLETRVTWMAFLLKMVQLNPMKHLAPTLPWRNIQAEKEQVKTPQKEAITQIRSGGRAAVNKAGFGQGQSETQSGEMF